MSEGKYVPVDKYPEWYRECGCLTTIRVTEFADMVKRVAAAALARGEDPIVAVKDLFDRSVLLGPPGIGKTEVLKQITRFLAVAYESFMRMVLSRGDYSKLPAYLRSRLESDLEFRDKLTRTIMSEGIKFVDLTSISAEDAVELLSRIESDPLLFTATHFLFYKIDASLIMPEDLMFPVMEELKGGHKMVEFVAPKRLALFALPFAHGVLFIDEIFNADRRTVYAMMNVILEKKLPSGQPLADGVIIFSASNPKSLGGAIEPPAPVMQRFRKYCTTGPSFEEWKKFVETNFKGRYEPLVLMFLDKRREWFNVINPEKSTTYDEGCNPRGWLRLALDLKAAEEALGFNLPDDISSTIRVDIGGESREVRVEEVVANIATADVCMPGAREFIDFVKSIGSNVIKNLISTLASINYREYADLLQGIEVDCNKLKRLLSSVVSVVENAYSVLSEIGVVNPGFFEVAVRVASTIASLNCRLFSMDLRELVDYAAAGDESAAALLTIYIGIAIGDACRRGKYIKVIDRVEAAHAITYIVDAVVAAKCGRDTAYKTSEVISEVRKIIRRMNEDCGGVC